MDRKSGANVCGGVEWAGIRDARNSTWFNNPSDLTEVTVYKEKKSFFSEKKAIF